MYLPPCCFCCSVEKPPVAHIFFFQVNEVKTEYVMGLKGGGDSDMAYLAFYRCKN